MHTITATEVKNQLGDLFDAVENDRGHTVLIERSRKPVAMLMNAQIAEKVILGAYAQGVLPRALAMQQLGLEWYGDLLQRLNRLGINRPAASPADVEAMQASLRQVFGPMGPRSPSTRRTKGPAAR